MCYVVRVCVMEVYCALGELCSVLFGLLVRYGGSFCALGIVLCYGLMLCVMRVFIHVSREF
jgi:hypothetical protein